MSTSQNIENCRICFVTLLSVTSLDMEIRADINNRNNEDDDNLIPVTDEDSDKVARKGNKHLRGKTIARPFFLAKRKI